MWNLDKTASRIVGGLYIFVILLMIKQWCTQNLGEPSKHEDLMKAKYGYDIDAYTEPDINNVELGEYIKFMYSDNKDKLEHKFDQIVFEHSMQDKVVREINKREWIDMEGIHIYLILEDDKLMYSKNGMDYKVMEKLSEELRF